MRGINAHTQRLAWTRQRGQRASALSLRLTGRRPSAWGERPVRRTRARVQGSASDTYREPALRASLPSFDSTPTAIRPPCDPAHARMLGSASSVTPREASMHHVLTRRQCAVSASSSARTCSRLQFNEREEVKFEDRHPEAPCGAAPAPARGRQRGARVSYTCNWCWRRGRRSARRPDGSSTGSSTASRRS
jgi:hypothetical protein